MTAKLQTLTIDSPGMFGMNTQQLSNLGTEWATKATNCVFDASGRLAARKGWIPLTSTPIENTPPVKQVAEYIKSNGEIEIISAAGSRLHTGTTAPTELTSITLATDDNWKMVNFRDFLYGFQRGHTPWKWDGTTMAESSDTTIPKAHEALAAFGRLWSADTDTNKTIVNYSALLDGDEWTAGTSGLLDLDLYLVGTDAVVALREYNGFLIVFCKDTIMVFEGAEDPNGSGFGLVETIRGVGCVARDLIQDIGDDLVFLSHDGLRSLSRTIQEKSMPFRDLSKNVRDYLNTYISSESREDMRSVYSPMDGFFLLSLPLSRRVFCFDTRTTLPDGSYRVTEWEGLNPSAMIYSNYAGSPQLLYGFDGVIGRSFGYTDNNSPYDYSYRSPWTDLGDSSKIKIPKRMYADVVAGASVDIDFVWSFDYSSKELSTTRTLSDATVAEYGVAEYNIGEWSGSGSLESIQTPTHSLGRLIRFGIDSVVNNYEMSLQRLSLYTKIGRAL